MSWIICGSVSAVLILLSIISYLRKDKGSLRVVFVLSYLFLATYIIYVPVYLSSVDLISGVIGNFIHTLRVIAIDADFLDFYDLICAKISNPIFASFYKIILGILHIALPAVSALTAVTVLFRCFSSLRLLAANLNKKPIFIFSEFNEYSAQLAKSLDDIACDIVFANSEKDSIDTENDTKHPFIFKDENITEVRIKQKGKKEVYLFCISENEDDSLSYSLKLIEKLREYPESRQEHIHIFQFSKFEDYSVYIDSADKGSLDVQCINEYEKLIYNLLNRYPLFKYAKDSIHLLIHGLSPINMVALKTVCWCGTLSGFSLKISVVGVDIQSQIDELKLNVPGLFSGRYDINFHNCRSEKEVIDIVSDKCPDANYIIVSDNNDNATMNLGLTLRRLYYKLDPEFKNCPPIFCYVKDPAKSNITENLYTAETNPKRKISYDLIPFGSLEEVYTYSELVESEIEKLAKNVHLAYEEIFSDGEIDVKEALKRYNTFEVNKRSNRANALHIRYKLNLLGLDCVKDDGTAGVNLADYYTNEQIVKMSVAEHDRWMAFLESEGWTVSTKDDVYAYRKSGISRGRHNCPILKMHPYICEYDKLKELSLELEGKDTTVYDTELILRIPDILGDKWNVTGTKYKIVKL